VSPPFLIHAGGVYTVCVLFLFLTCGEGINEVRQNTRVETNTISNERFI